MRYEICGIYNLGRQVRRVCTVESESETLGRKSKGMFRQVKMKQWKVKRHWVAIAIMEESLKKPLIMIWVKPKVISG